jgi:hypothetical protein
MSLRSLAKTRVPVYRGYRRYRRDIRPFLPPQLDRSAANRLLLSDSDLKFVADQAVAVVAGPWGVQSKPLAEWSTHELLSAEPVRRLGSYPKARNQLALHCVPYRGGWCHIWCESQFELAWARGLDRDPNVLAYDTQCVVLVFPMDGRCLWHVPDFLALERGDVPALYDVKSLDDLEKSHRTTLQMRLTRMACEQAGWGWRLLSDISRRRRATLSQLQIEAAGLPGELESSEAAARAARGGTVGEVVAAAGGGPSGHRVAMHLLATGVIDADLDRPLEYRTPVTWFDEGSVVIAEQRGVKEIRVATTWLKDTINQAVQGISLENAQPVFAVLSEGGLEHVGPTRLVESYAERQEVDPADRMLSRDRLRWEQLPAAKRREAQVLLAHLLEWRTGSKTGLLVPGQVVDPRYDPALPLLERRDSKAAELGVSVSTLSRKWQAHQDRPFMGLLHGNTGGALRDPLLDFDELDLAVAAEVFAELRYEAGRDVDMTVAVFEARLIDAGVQLDTSRVEVLFAELDRGVGMDRDSATRATTNNRRSRPGKRDVDRLPGERVEMDSSKADVELWLPGCDDSTQFRTSTIALIDAASGTSHTRGALGAPTGRDTALCLGDVLCPWDLTGRGDDVWETFIGVPREVVVFERLAMQIGTVVVDQGREYMNAHFLRVLVTFAIDLIMASVYDPQFKHFIEQLFRTINKFQQTHAAYVGNSVSRKPLRTPAMEDRLTFGEFQHEIQMWAHHTHNNESRRQHPLAPGRLLSPNQIRALALTEGAPLRIPSHPNRVLDFMPAKALTVNSDGLHSGDVRYWAPEFEELCRRSAGTKRVPPRKVLARYDPYDLSRMYVTTPDTVLPVVARAIDVDGDHYANFSDLMLQKVKSYKGLKPLPKGALHSRRVDLVRYTEAVLEGRDRDAKKRLAVDFLKGKHAVAPPQTAPPAGPSLGQFVLEQVGASAPVITLDDEPVADFDISRYRIAESFSEEP